MSVTPTSELAIATAQLRRMFALSATFQSEGGFPSYEIALESVYTRSVDPTTVPRPHVILMPGDRHDLNLVAGGAQNELRHAGSILVYLSRDVSAEHLSDSVAAGLEAENFFGTVIEDVAKLSGADDTASAFERCHLSVHHITRLSFEPVAFGKKGSQGAFFHTVYLFEWGDGDT